jgi:hypothetical protein
VQTPVQTSDQKHPYLQGGSNPVCASAAKPLLSGGFFGAASSCGGTTGAEPRPGSVRQSHDVSRFREGELDWF